MNSPMTSALKVSAWLFALQAAPAWAEDSATIPVFSAEEVAWSKGYGPNIVDGIASASGEKDTATCAGEQVYLRPGSALERHRGKIIFGNSDGARISVDKYMNPPAATAANMPTPPKDYDAVARKASCSIDGKFLFAGIPDGNYYVITMLLPRAYVGKVTPYEDIEVVMKRVTVAGGQTVKLDLLAKP